MAGFLVPVVLAALTTGFVAVLLAGAAALVTADFAVVLAGLAGFLAAATAFGFTGFSLDLDDVAIAVSL
jgi:ParB-like chromosome segregation protein Spo0J